MKTLRTVLPAIALLCFAPFLHAQDDAKRAAAADEMLTAMHAGELITKLMAVQKENTTKMIQARIPKNLPPDTAKKIDDAVAASVDAMFKQLSWESLKPDFIKVNASVYTEQELKDLTAFYKSPLGQKEVEKMPEIQAKTAQIIHDRITALMPAMQSAIKDAVEKSRDSAPAPQQ